MIPFDSAEQINMRLKGTGVVYKEQEVVHVLGANGVNSLHIRHKGGNEQLVQLNSPDINYTDFKLGYFLGLDPRQEIKSAMYVERVPARQQRQGLHFDYLRFKGEDKGNGNQYLVADRNSIYSPEFMQMLKGEYPTFDKALEMIEKNDNTISAPISRRFAVMCHKDLGFYTLHFKGARVAWGDPYGFNVPSEYSYLKEIIEKSGVKIR